jgi:hypothetical protein
MGDKLFDCRAGEGLATPNGVLSPQQQISLHFLCLIREHKLDKLAWHLSGIRRAIRLSANALAPSDREPEPFL